MTILIFILPCEQHLIWFSFEENNLCPISCKLDQFSCNPMSIQRCILFILRGIVGYIKTYESTFWMYMDGFGIMVTPSVYFEYKNMFVYKIEFHLFPWAISMNPVQVFKRKLDIKNLTKFNHKKEKLVKFTLDKNIPKNSQFLCQNMA